MSWAMNCPNNGQPAAVQSRPCSFTAVTDAAGAAERKDASSSPASAGSSGRAARSGPRLRQPAHRPSGSVPSSARWVIGGRVRLDGEVVVAPDTRADPGDVRPVDVDRDRGDVAGVAYAVDVAGRSKPAHVACRGHRGARLDEAAPFSSSSNSSSRSMPWMTPNTPRSRDRGWASPGPGARPAPLSRSCRRARVEHLALGLFRVPGPLPGGEDARRGKVPLQRGGHQPRPYPPSWYARSAQRGQRSRARSVRARSAA